MQAQKILALSSKLKTVSPDKRAHLLSYLPENTRSAIEDPSLYTETISVPLYPEKLARRVDISHFKHYLDHISESERDFFTSAFPKYKQVQLSNTHAAIGEFVQSKFSNHVLQLLFKKALADYPPPSLLPKHKLTELLADTGVPLSKLVYYMGFYDVVREIKKIISHKTLKQLQDSLAPEEIAFINAIGREEKVMMLSTMNLHLYNGDKDKLEALILERGIYRFTQGIKNVPMQYLFFFTYFLPKDISDKINALLDKKEHFAKGYTGWEDDILKTWRFLCTYSK
jgi:hypothetical protein